MVAAGVAVAEVFPVAEFVDDELGTTLGDVVGVADGVKVGV